MSMAGPGDKNSIGERRGFVKVNALIQSFKSISQALQSCRDLKCVRIVGTIETYKNRPAIIIQSRDQVLPCLGKK